MVFYDYLQIVATRLFTLICLPSKQGAKVAVNSVVLDKSYIRLPVEVK